MRTKIMDMLNGRCATGLALGLQLLQSFPQGGSAREVQMRRMLGCLAQADPDMEELQMCGKRTSCGKGRCKNGSIRIAAANRYQE
jgi:hypothetical protein